MTEKKNNKKEDKNKDEKKEDKKKDKKDEKKEDKNKDEKKEDKNKDEKKEDKKNIEPLIIIIDINKEEENEDSEEDKDDNYYGDNYNKRKFDNDDYYTEPDSMNNLFSKFMFNSETKQSKKRKIDYIDEFKQYFKESDILLPINKEIKTLNDLIELGKTYDPYDKNRYVINLFALNKCVDPLTDLNLMIGMKNIKEMIIDLIFFRLQNLEDNSEELWHLVIQGTPGSGKTEVARIIGRLYYSLGIVKKDKFTLVKRSDLIGKYLGHTAKMTQDIFNNARGGILFIDEAYSLGNSEGRDSFSKECIDTINQNLTENKDTVVFIAGYKDQLNESFFSYNPGLNRRFKMRLTIDKYSASDLREIFIKKIKINNWLILNDNIEKELPLVFFEKNLSIFKYNGGDMENLWHLTKIVHSRRIFGKSHDIQKKIIKEDIENGFKLYSENEEVQSRNDTFNKYLMSTMYS